MGPWKELAVPAAAALLVAAALSVAGRRFAPRAARAVATAIGFLAGFGVVLGGLPIRPTEATHWLVWLAVSAAVFEAARGREPSRRVGTGVLRAAAAVVMLWVLLKQLGAPWEGWSFAALCLALAVFLASLERATKGKLWLGRVTTASVLVGSIGVLAMGYSFVLAILAVSLLAAWAGVGADWLLGARATPAAGGASDVPCVFVVGVLTFGLWLLGLGYADARPAAVALLGAAPLCACIVASLVARFRPAVASLFGAAGAVACALAALVLAWNVYEPAPW